MKILHTRGKLLIVFTLFILITACTVVFMNYTFTQMPDKNSLAGGCKSVSPGCGVCLETKIFGYCIEKRKQ